MDSSSCFPNTRLLLSLRNEPCRIICTQPRRISAITVAERVATEWGEGIGQTVGFNVRLESKSSAATQLLFCTTGTVLRMMASNKTLAGVTHLVLDEVHERDRFRWVSLHGMVTSLWPPHLRRRLFSPLPSLPPPPATSC